MNKLNKLLLSVFSTLTLVSCGNSFEFKEGPADDFTGRFNFSASELTFENISKRILNNKINNSKSCNECHIGYKDYSFVASESEREKILSAVLEERMPKNQPALSDELKALLTAWVDAGAPLDDGTTNTQPIEPIEEELEATWASLSREVFFPKCVQCHNPNGQAKFLDLSTRQKFFEQRKELLNNLENAESSFLIEVITDPVEPMPPVSSGLERLTDEEVKIVIEWIEKGLP